MLRQHLTRLPVLEIDPGNQSSMEEEQLPSAEETKHSAPRLMASYGPLSKKSLIPQQKDFH